MTDDERRAGGDRRASVDARLEALEAFAREYENNDGRLVLGVERLSTETGALNEILTKVDEQQQRQQRLARQLKDVKESTATYAEVDQRVDQATRTRWWRVIAAVSPFVLIIGMLLFGLSESAHDACERRQASTRVLITLLEDFKSGGPGDARIDRGISKLKATLDATCDEQYPLHWF